MPTWMKTLILFGGMIGAVITFTKDAEKLSRIR